MNTLLIEVRKSLNGQNIYDVSDVAIKIALSRATQERGIDLLSIDYKHKHFKDMIISHIALYFCHPNFIALYHSALDAINYQKEYIEKRKINRQTLLIQFATFLRVESVLTNEQIAFVDRAFLYINEYLSIKVSIPESSKPLLNNLVLYVAVAYAQNNDAVRLDTARQIMNTIITYGIEVGMDRLPKELL